MSLIRHIAQKLREQRNVARARMAQNRKASLLRAKDMAVERALIITGDPRGGTTWLMEMLARLPGTVVNWEPLHHDRGVVPESWRWGRRPHFPEGDREPHRMERMREILTFQRSTQWTTRYTAEEQAAGAQQVLTKFIRANLLLPWITSAFKLDRKPICLLRHPVPTVISQLKAFPHDRTNSVKWTAPDQLFNEEFQENEEYVNRLAPGLERQVALWCVGNLSTLRHPGHGQSWLVIYYEDLLLDPVNELRRIEEAWDLDAGLLTGGDLRRASRTDFRKDLKASPEDQLRKWQSGMDAGVLERVQQVLDHYGVDFYAAAQAKPLRRPPG